VLLEFGPFRLDVVAGRLLRDGRPVPLRPKAWAVLRYLVERPGALVTKEELLDAIWPGLVLNEEAAPRHVRELRDVLGDTGQPARYLETVPRRGFRFVAPVVRVAAAAAPVAGPGPPPRDVASPVGSAWTTLGLGSEGVRSSEPFIGRTAELDAIVAALARVRSRVPVLIAVSGDPGIGKTRLLAEASRIAAADGFRVLAGCCFEEEGQPPFWPWVQLLRGLDRPGGAPAPPAAEHSLAGLVPGLADVSQPAGAVDEHGAQQARLRVFDALLASLRALAADRPLLLLIDDLHWADGESLALLQSAVGDVEGLALCVLGTHRVDEGRAADALKRIAAWLDRRGRFRHVPLRGLDRNETGELLHALAGGDVAGTLVETVHGRTDGNPYFTGELWRHLRDAGSIASHDGAFVQTAETHGVPDGVRATIGLRLARLGDDCRRLLGVASVCGVEFDFDLVRAVAALDEDAALSAIEQAEAAGLVREAGGPAGRYRFGHALARECLYDELGALRRARLHWALGEELERRYGADGEAHAAELSHHFTSGAGRGDRDKAVAYALRAARRATAGHGYEAAATHLERALGVLDGAVERTRPLALVRRRELLLELAASCERAGDGRRARARYEEAAALARDAGDDTHLARAALGMATRWTFEDAAVIALLEQALAGIPASAEPMRARLLARLAQALYLLPDTRARREALCEESLALARRIGDPMLLGEVLADCLEALFHSDNVAERESLASALYAVASASGSTALRLQAHAWRIVGSMSRGRLREADDELATFFALAREVRQPRFLGIASTFQATLDIVRGRLASAEEHARAAARWGERFSQYYAAHVGFIQMFSIRREQGRTFGLESDDGAIRVPQSDDPGAALFVRSSRWQLPFAFAEQGELDKARESFAQVTRELDELPAENSRNSRVMAISMLSEVAALFGARRVAETLLPLTAPYGDQWVVVGFGALLGISVQGVRGNLLAAMGAWDEAAQHYERAIAEHDREQAAVVQARTLHAYARMLLARGHPRDRARAGALIERGATIAAATGLGASAQKLARLRETLAGARGGGTRS